MNRLSKLLLISLVASIAAFGAYYALSVAPVRAMLCGRNPEMDWLRREYHLDSFQFTVVSRLHDDYVPRCREMCARITARRALILQLAHDNRAGTCSAT